MNHFLLAVILFSSFSCIRHPREQNETIQSFDSSSEPVKVTRAEGFDLFYGQGYVLIKTHSIEGNTFFRDSICLVDEKEAPLPEGAKAISSADRSIVCQSMTYLPFFHVLHQLKLVKGLCGLSYVPEGRISRLLYSVGTKEICLGQRMQLETILSVRPDLLLAHPFDMQQVSTLEKKSLPTLVMAEYLERHPIARLEWIKLVGVLLRREREAVRYFDEVSAVYEKWKRSPAATSPTYFFNLPYGDHWYMPSTNSLVVQLLKDAGLTYYYSDGEGTENELYPQEKVWNDGAEVDYWVIIASRPAGFSMRDLLAENEIYRTFSSVQHGRVIFCNTATSGYFLRAIVEPHILLKDLLFATGQISNHQPRYFHILK